MSEMVTFKHASFRMEERNGIDWVYYFEPGDLKGLDRFWKVRAYGWETYESNITVFDNELECFENILDNFEYFTPDEPTCKEDGLWERLITHIFGVVEHAYDLNLITDMAVCVWLEQAGVEVSCPEDRMWLIDRLAYAIADQAVKWDEIYQNLYERITMRPYGYKETTSEEG